jgi:hypothetical protein
VIVASSRTPISRPAAIPTMTYHLSGPAEDACERSRGAHRGAPESRQRPPISRKGQDCRSSTSCRSSSARRHSQTSLRS